MGPRGAIADHLGTTQVTRVIYGSIIGLALVVALLVGTAISGGAREALQTGLGLIAFYGFCAGRLAGEGLVRALVQAFLVGLVTGALIALKTVPH